MISSPAGAVAAIPVAAGHPAKISTRRIVYIGLAIALVAGGATIYGPQLLYTTSSEAILNARIITIATPIEGRVVAPPPADGSVVAWGAPLVTIQNPTVDRSRLQDLKASRTRTQVQIVGLKHLRDILTAELAMLNKQNAAYRGATVTRLALTASAAKDDALAAQALAHDAQQNYQRKHALRAGTTISLADIDHAGNEAVRTQAVAESLRLTAQRLADELEAAKSGVLVGANRNDVPYSQQRADEYRVRKAETKAQIATLAARLAQFELQLAAERARDAKLAATELTAPAPGVVWRPLVAAGSAVARNSDLMSLIDCSTLYVTAVFGSQQFENLYPGRPAVVHVLGTGSDYPATIVDTRAMQGSDTAERFFAAPLPKLDDRQILAVLRIDDPGKLASQGYCSVGRRVEVRFPDRVESRLGLTPARR